MSFLKRISIEIEARRLIRRARKVSEMAASWRSENTPHLCLICRLHLCALYRIPLWAIQGACVIAAAADLYGLHKFGAF